MQKLENTVLEIAARVKRIEEILDRGPIPPNGPPPWAPSDDVILKEFQNKIDSLSKHLTSIVQKSEMDDLKKEIDDLKRIVALLGRYGTRVGKARTIELAKGDRNMVTSGKAASVDLSLDETVTSQSVSMTVGEAHGD